MNALVELMGSLSNVRFATVSDRFIAELEKYKTGAPVKDKDRELRMEMLIRGMRYLNLKASLFFYVTSFVGAWAWAWGGGD